MIFYGMTFGGVAFRMVSHAITPPREMTSYGTTSWNNLSWDNLSSSGDNL